MFPSHREDPGLQEGRAFAAAVPAAYLAWALSQIGLALVVSGPEALKPTLILVGLSGIVVALPSIVLAVAVGGLFYIVFEATLGIRRPTVWAGGLATGVLVGAFVGSWSGPAAVALEVCRGAAVGGVTAEVWWRVWSRGGRDAHRA